MTPTDTVLIADDHPLLIDIATQLLKREGFNVVASTGNGTEALRLINEIKPCIALLDLHMPGLGGLEIARRIARTSPATSVIVYTGFANSTVLTEAIDSGAKGFVSKAAPTEDLVRAVRSVSEGGTYIDPVLAGSLVVNTPSHPQLSKREREILRLLSDGKTNEAIGKELFLSPETIRTHVRNAMVKLSAKTRTQAVVIAMRTNQIS